MCTQRIFRAKNTSQDDLEAVITDIYSTPIYSVYISTAQSEDKIMLAQGGRGKSLVALVALVALSHAADGTSARRTSTVLLRTARLVLRGGGKDSRQRDDGGGEPGTIRVKVHPSGADVFRGTFGECVRVRNVRGYNQ